LEAAARCCRGRGRNGATYFEENEAVVDGTMPKLSQNMRASGLINSELYSAALRYAMTKVVENRDYASLMPLRAEYFAYLLVPSLQVSRKRPFR